MRAAIVKKGIVENVIVVDEENLEAFGAIPCDDLVSVGWVYRNGEFRDPPENEEEKNQ